MLSSIIFLVFLFIVVLFFGGYKVIKGHMFKYEYRLKKLIKRLNSPVRRLDTGILSMKEQAVKMQIKVSELERSYASISDEKLKNDAKILSEKLGKKAQELAQKAIDWESRKATIVAKREYLEQKLEFIRMEKGLLNDMGFASDLTDLDKEILEIEDEISAIEKLF